MVIILFIAIAIVYTFWDGYQAAVRRRRMQDRLNRAELPEKRKNDSRNE